MKCPSLFLVIEIKTFVFISSVSLLLKDVSCKERLVVIVWKSLLLIGSFSLLTFDVIMDSLVYTINNVSM